MVASWTKYCTETKEAYYNSYSNYAFCPLYSVINPTFAEISTTNTAKHSTNTSVSTR